MGYGTRLHDTLVRSKTILMRGQVNPKASEQKYHTQCPNINVALTINDTGSSSLHRAILAVVSYVLGAARVLAVTTSRTPFTTACAARGLHGTRQQ